MAPSEGAKLGVSFVFFSYISRGDESFKTRLINSFIYVSGGPAVVVLVAVGRTYVTRHVATSDSPECSAISP
jgi:hypothetical protein